MNTYNNNIKFTEEDLLKLKIRNIIYRFILENPGLHFRELVRKLNIPKTTLSYHLRYLEKNELLVTKKEGRYVRYFISKNIDNKEKIILNIIRQETTRNILLYIVVMVCASQNEIAKELAIYPTTVKFHLKKLLKSDLIEPAYIKNGIVYTCYSNHAILKRDPIKNEIIYTSKQRIYKFLIKYYHNKYYKGYLSKALMDVAESANPDGPPKKLKPLKQQIEQFEKCIFEIFPHPYYA